MISSSMATILFTQFYLFFFFLSFVRFYVYLFRWWIWWFHYSCNWLFFSFEMESSEWLTKKTKLITNTRKMKYKWKFLYLEPDRIKQFSFFLIKSKAFTKNIYFQRYFSTNYSKGCTSCIHREFSNVNMIQSFPMRSLKRKIYCWMMHQCKNRVHHGFNANVSNENFQFFQFFSFICFSTGTLCTYEICGFELHEWCSCFVLVALTSTLGHISRSLHVPFGRLFQLNQMEM